MGKKSKGEEGRGQGWRTGEGVRKGSRGGDKRVSLNSGPLLMSGVGWGASVHVNTIGDSLTPLT